MNLTLLLVEDNLELQALLRERIERYGFKVETANNGQMALDWIRTHHVDVILSDIEMPKLTGIGLLQALTKEGSLIPIFLMSGNFAYEKRELLKMGALGFFGKPDQIGQIGTAICAHFMELRDRPKRQVG